MSNISIKKTFTIIVPCYNSQNFAKHALKSIVDCNYDMDKIEVLIIDDGSKDQDDFYKTIENFFIQYPKTFKYYKKENGNWGSVINYAKKNKLINNDLVCILDSDDKFKPNFFDVVNNEIKDADIFLGTFELLNKKHKKILNVRPYLFNKKIITDSKKYTSMNFPGSTIYTKKIFYLNIQLEEGHSYQDFPFFFNALKIAKKIIWTKKVISQYWRTRPGNSMSSTWSDKKFNDWVIAFNNLEKNNIGGYFYWVILQKGCLKAFKRRKMTLQIKEKPSFKWAPIWLRWFLHIYWLLICKQILKIKH